MFVYQCVSRDELFCYNFTITQCEQMVLLSAQKLPYQEHDNKVKELNTKGSSLCCDRLAGTVSFSSGKTSMIIRMVFQNTCECSTLGRLTNLRIFFTSLY